MDTGDIIFDRASWDKTVGTEAAQARWGNVREGKLVTALSEKKKNAEIVLQVTK